MGSFIIREGVIEMQRAAVVSCGRMFNACRCVHPAHVGQIWGFPRNPQNQWYHFGNKDDSMLESTSGIPLFWETTV